jgi:hypothetical protein
MKKMFFKITSAFSLAMLIVLSIPAAPVAAALGISSIVPNSIANNSATTITVTGTDFVSGAVVILEGYGALDTNFHNASVLTAVVPAGVPASVYDVTVKTDADSVTCTGCLTVTAPIPPTATPTEAPFGRPQITVSSYKASVSVIQFGQDFNLAIQLHNSGQRKASNVQVAFATGDLIPRKTGGVVVAGDIGPNKNANISQPMTASADLWGKTAVTVVMTITYYDGVGTPYSETFTLSLPVQSPSVTYGTATPTGVSERPQVVITHYESSVVPLQPGVQFELKMDVQNVGGATAKRLTMIVGGGSVSGGEGGTPGPGGVSGGSGEFTNFAPIGSSNIQSLGDLGAASTLQASQMLIVNVSTQPGAYPMKITFSYEDSKGAVHNDDQVITLLVYNLPKVDISFYRPLDPFFAGQMGVLPIQIVNLGRSLAVLGTIRVETGGADMFNNTMLVGALDTGGYTTLDVSVTPYQAGPLELNITIDYTDDFNQARTITKTISVDVQDAMIEPPFNGGGIPGEGGGEMPATEETFWQKLWRFILGLFGLDSGAPQPPTGPTEVPVPGPIIKPGKG